MSIRTTALTAAIAVLLCASAVSASADAAETDTQSASVSLRGVNLDTASGQATLRHRLRAAANAVCGSADARDLQAAADLRNCRADAFETALGEMQVALADRHHRLAGGQMVELSSNAR